MLILWYSFKSKLTCGHEVAEKRRNVVAKEWTAEERLEAIVTVTTNARTMANHNIRALEILISGVDVISVLADKPPELLNANPERLQEFGVSVE